MQTAVTILTEPVITLQWIQPARGKIVGYGWRAGIYNLIIWAIFNGYGELGHRGETWYEFCNDYEMLPDSQGEKVHDLQSLVLLDISILVLAWVGLVLGRDEEYIFTLYFHSHSWH